MEQSVHINISGPFTSRESESENFYHPQRSCGKVMFSQAYVKNSVHGGGGCIPGQTPPRQTPPPFLDTTGYGQQVGGILLECILVFDICRLLFDFFASSLIFSLLLSVKRPFQGNTFLFCLCVVFYIFFIPNDALAKALQYLKIRYYERWLFAFSGKVSICQRFRCIVQTITN